MTVLDASALLALLVDEPARPVVEQLLRARPSPVISAVNLAEVVDKLVRVRGHDGDLVRDRINLLIAAGLQVEPVWLRVTWLAASIRAAHYHRDRAALSMADCVCLATAVTLEADLATTDSLLADAARAAGLSVIALPDSSDRT